MLEFVVVTREYLLSLLDAWQQNKITAAELYETANQLYDADNTKVLDWENGDGFSVTMEVLQYLESLNMNFIVQEDIEPCKEFLQTKMGHYKEGTKKWQQYTSSINYEERMKQLKGQYPYIS
ncbi:MAG: hypothetical protein LF885_03105 [Rickettsia endosymbiont of Culicoides impunctatus]|uniref:hypothetical protein n=1 Tax=unclassified Candidatus Tisiphia TaxID=2996318 RepID=UPI001E6AF850|nr:hypothetical protein [Rickettsia endosymbiont of Platyusa sonomae]UCM86220.1 MAG: hypothetical protein LF885_03105 [Rickettsia endosymbiont of Culicoides impunctatus]